LPFLAEFVICWFFVYEKLLHNKFVTQKMPALFLKFTLLRVTEVFANYCICRVGAFLDCTIFEKCKRVSNGWSGQTVSNNAPAFIHNIYKIQS
jgi:hypothetical protein